MIRETAKAFARQVPAIENLIKQRDNLLLEAAELRQRCAALLQTNTALLQTQNRRHFVDGYEVFVQQLIASHPLDEAMSLAVGGHYDEVGKAELAILRNCGIREDTPVIDLGCGSGRLAKHLGLNFPRIGYLGTDVVQELLDYAAKQSPAHFRFVRHCDLSIPAPDQSTFFVTAFSVFTHLFHEESYLYLQECKRVLQPLGCIVFSFLESTHNWPVFDGMLSSAKAGHKTHLNMFIERTQIEAWAKRLDLDLLGYDFAPPHDGHGQTVAVLRKPA
jgi:ubiquinone/menaquinone biosynthesis C-methylase UbiE